MLFEGNKGLIPLSSMISESKCMGNKPALAKLNKATRRRSSREQPSTVSKDTWPNQLKCMQHVGIRATPAGLRKDTFYKLMKHPSTSKVGWLFGKIVF